jgi:hypothetical protein
MTPDELDLAPEAYAPLASDEVRAGDVCRAVGLPDLSEAELSFSSDDLPGRQLIPVQPGYALVVATYEIYATVVPVMVAESVTDEGAFNALVATGDDAPRWMRLPPLEGSWPQDAVALFFIPHTLLGETLLERRVASMHPHARSIVERRFARSLSDHDDD